MKKFTMSAYIKALKEAAKNTNISDEEFVRELFNTLIISGNVKDKNDSQPELVKAKVSRLLAQKDNVPGAMKKALEIYNIETKITTQTEYEPKPLVSENTLHGKWLRRWRESGKTIKELDIRIDENIRLQGLKPVGEATAENGKRYCYPIGSVVNLEVNNAIYYLLAISDFDINNNARSEKEKIKTAIV